MDKQWSAFFSEAQLLYQPSKLDGVLNLPLSDNRFLALDKAQLTARELFILEQLLGAKDSLVSLHPWQAFLFEGGAMPKSAPKRLQCLHIDIKGASQDNLSQAFSETFSELLPHSIASFFSAPNRLMVLLNQQPHLSVKSSVEAILPVLEADFGCQLTALIGQIWDREANHQWGNYLVKESHALDQYLVKSGRSQVLVFSDLLHWLATESQPDFQYFMVAYYNLLHQYEMEELVLALWQEQGVQTKAAKRLFLHRNTLQHKLERFEEATGLDLKQMNALSLCYLAIQAMTF